MNIKYQSHIYPKNGTRKIAHDILPKEIKEFIEECDTRQNSYKFESNDSSLFIYFNNGDRLNCELK